VEYSGPVCAAKLVSDRYCEVAEAEGFASDVCSYLRVGLGMAKLSHDAGGEPLSDAPYGGMPKPDLLIGFHEFCDGRYKWMQQLARYLDAPYFGFDLKEWPEGWDTNDPDLKRHLVNHAYEQLRRLVAFLEKMTGKRLDKYRLSEHLRYWMESSEDSIDYDFPLESIAGSFMKDRGRARWCVVTQHTGCARLN